MFSVACDPWGIHVERVEVLIHCLLFFVIYILIFCIFQVKNLSVAKEMIKSMAVEAQAAREANGLLIMQNGEGTCLEKIK